MKGLFRFLFLPALLVACSSVVSAQDERTLFFPRSTEYVECMPPADRVWLFVLAGQSNMAGRGLVEPSDTIPHPRIFSVTPDKRWVVAKEPLQRYQPALTGLGPGMAFARAVIEVVDKEISIGLIPCAVGGSSTTDWLSDSVYNGVRLKRNMEDLVRWAMDYGTVKGVIWHQGESDANADKIPFYRENTETLFNFFRSLAGDTELPIVAGELGIFTGVEKKRLEYLQINDILSSIADEDPNTVLVRSFGTEPKADNVHFDGPSQRIMGRRYALAWLSLVRSRNR